MNNVGVGRTRMKRLCQAMVGVYTVLAAGHAIAANYWQGTASDQVSDISKWSAGSLYGGGAVLNGAAAWNDTTATNAQFGSQLYVGYGTGNSGVLNIAVPASVAGYYLATASNPDTAAPFATLTYTIDPLFRVGDAGGAGTINADISSVYPYPQNRISSFSTSLGVGLGTGSVGTFNLLGGGKQPSEIRDGSQHSWVFNNQGSGSTLVGSHGGTGQVSVDGAGLFFRTGAGVSNELNYPMQYFVVGDGAGATGVVNVLGSGKLVTGDPYDTYNSGRSGNVLPYNYIGRNSGTGTVTVQATTTSGIQNQADFYAGLAVGAAGGNGTLDILQGGKSLINMGTLYSSQNVCTAVDPTNYPAAPASLQISADSASTGLVRASGAGAQLLVAGKVPWQYSGTVWIQDHSIGKIQVGTGGTLVTADSAVVKVGITKYSQTTISTPIYNTYYESQTLGGLGPINVNGSGSVVYGSESTTPVAPGSIEALQINLTGAASQLKFNHTSSNLSFNLPLSGSGQIVQQAGTTTISTSLVGLPALDSSVWAFDTGTCAPTVSTAAYPTDQSAFTGSLNVQGGTLVLPATNVLPGLTATTISGGVLAQGSTNQNLGAVTQTGGVLQLTGGTATDVANASSWTGGGGAVQLDTVLGDSSSASDILHVTGAISGTTYLTINNFSGAGALTTGNGILVVQVDSANASNSFALSGPVTVNGYTYTLKQVGNNWYLSSATSTTGGGGTGSGGLVPVPTLSWLGLLGLGGLLSAFSSAAVRRRKARPH